MVVMPDKPDTWAHIAAWLHEHFPEIYAVVFSFGIAILRVTYDGSDRRRQWLEGLLCGAITSVVIGCAELAGAILGFTPPASMAGTIGGLVGLFGVNKVRALAERYIDFRLGRRDGN